MAILKGIKDRIDVEVTAECAYDLGTTVEVPFVVTYKRRGTRKERMAFSDTYFPKRDEAGEVIEKESELWELEMFSECVLGWSSLPDQSGVDIPFTPENLALLVEVPEYNTALWDGLRKSLAIGKVAQEKNS